MKLNAHDGLVEALRETRDAAEELMRWISDTDIDHAHLYRLMQRMEKFEGYGARANTALAAAEVKVEDVNAFCSDAEKAIAKALEDRK